jgi:putative transport protein
MDWIVRTIRENPELALFLTLALGFVFGRIRVRKFRLGNVVGTLLAGVLVGQLHVDIDPLVKVVFFDLFLFATGYKVGPQFFRGLRSNALSQALLTLVLCVVSLLTTLVAARVMDYDMGTAAGLLAGAFTESTVIGTAGNAISSLSLPDAEKERLLNNIPVAYAVSYLIGTTLVVWFLSNVAPRLLRSDLRVEAQKLAAAGASGPTGEATSQSAYREWDMRAFRLPENFAGRTVADVEAWLAPARVFVLRLRRGPELLQPAAGTVLQAGDLAVIAARREVLFGSAASFGEEVHDRELLDFPLAAADLVVTRSDVAGRTIGEMAAEHGRGVALRELIRAGEQIPFGPGTVLDRGDLLRVVGTESDVERAGAAIGYVERPSSETDVVFVGLGILVGGLFGALTLNVGALPISLTASGGALVMGLVFGWLRSMRPTFGRIPEPALWVFDTLGLAVFIGCVGLAAGPSFVSGLRTTGPGLVLVAAVVALVPHTVAVLFGRYVLKMNPVLLLGACSGAGTATAALRAVQDEAGSKLPVLGYTVPYALGNILLTAWGPVIIYLMS